MAGLDATGIQQVASMVQSYALKIIGGIPILKNTKGSTNELLKLPKHIDIGNVGPLLNQVLNSGIGSMLQNPLAAAAGAAAGTLGGAAAAVTSALGSAGSAVTAALGAVQGSIGAASALAANLSGMASAAGLPTNIDLLSHAGLASGFGADLPPSLSLATAAAPLVMGAQIASAATQAAALAQQAVSGGLTPAAAAAGIATIQAGIDGVVNGSIAAINVLQARGPDLAAAQAAVACLCPGAVPDELRAAMQGCFLPTALAQAQQIADDHFAAVMASASS